MVPTPGNLLDVDRKAVEEFKDVKDKMEQLLDGFHFREAQKEAMNLARIGNRYITECEPWKVWKTDPDRVKTVLYISLQLVANLSIAFEPFLPFSSKDLRAMLRLDSFDWKDLGSTELLKPGHQLAEPHLLFEKIEDEVIRSNSTSSLPRRRPTRPRRLLPTTRRHRSSRTSISASGRSSTSVWVTSRTATL